MITVARLIVGRCSVAIDPGTVVVNMGSDSRVVGVDVDVWPVRVRTVAVIMMFIYTHGMILCIRNGPERQNGGAQNGCHSSHVFLP